ncbi:unnamed protein product [Symbiodinium sp. CCMP2592]|nr:unnamed protein product [Symbiodinium sp. CCMP2592]
MTCMGWIVPGQSDGVEAAAFDLPVGAISDDIAEGCQLIRGRGPRREVPVVGRDSTRKCQSPGCCFTHQLGNSLDHRRQTRGSMLSPLPNDAGAPTNCPADDRLPERQRAAS